MCTWRPGETSLNRTARVASLYQPSGLRERQVMLLIEPKVIHLPLDGEVWQGTQLANTKEGVREFAQAWLVRPRAKDGQPLPPFDVQRWMAIRRASGDMPAPPVGKGWEKPGNRRRT